MDGYLWKKYGRFNEIYFVDIIHRPPTHRPPTNWPPTTCSLTHQLTDLIIIFKSLGNRKMRSWQNCFGIFSDVGILCIIYFMNNICLWNFEQLQNNMVSHKTHAGRFNDVFLQILNCSALLLPRYFEKTYNSLYED